MIYLYSAIIAIAIAAAGLFFGTMLFFQEYDHLYNYNYFLGLFSGSFICFASLYLLERKHHQLYEKTKHYDYYKSELTECRTKIQELYKNLDEAKQRTDIIRAIERIFANHERDLEQFIIQQNKFQFDKLNNSLEEIKTELPAGNNSDIIKKQQAALAAFRQERAAFKEVTSTVTFDNGITLWDEINFQMSRAKKDPVAIEQKPKKTFVPSAPNRGPRAAKYNQH